MAESPELFDGVNCPKSHDDADETVQVTQSVVMSNGSPAIQLMAECTCGWNESRIIRGEKTR